MNEILESLKIKSAEMRAEANLGNTPNNQAWFEYRIHFLDGFDSAISSVENMLNNQNSVFDSHQLPLIRRSIPSTLASQIIPVEPINNQDLQYTHRQDVDYFDPRQRMASALSDLGDKVQVRRVIISEPVNSKSIITIQNVTCIEILKEYTFDEWDRALTVAISQATLK